MGDTVTVAVVVADVARGGDIDEVEDNDGEGDGTVLAVTVEVDEDWMAWKVDANRSHSCTEVTAESEYTLATTRR